MDPPDASQGAGPPTLGDRVALQHPDQPAADETLGSLEVVHLFDEAMPTGVSVSHTGRVFVCYPKWGDEVGFTVGEIRDGEVVAFPSQELNDNRSDADPERL